MNLAFLYKLIQPNVLMRSAMIFRNLAAQQRGSHLTILNLSEFDMRLLLSVASFAFVSAAFAQTPAAPAAPAVTPAPVAASPTLPLPPPRVLLSTSMGEITIELNPERAPITVENFLGYVRAGQYDGTVFHRVIPDFMVQGGGYMTSLAYKQTRAPIKNEANNGLKNLRTTVAMARLGDPDSASSQFFINVMDNAQLNYTGPQDGRTWGYAVFGKVVSGMDVVDKIRYVPTNNDTPDFQNKPVESVVIQKATVVPPPSTEIVAPVPAVAAPAAAPVKK
jgi:peptidyl-prolyl cis-trans isomerase A (cyclophilin A)